MAEDGVFSSISSNCAYSRERRHAVASTLREEEGIQDRFWGMAEHLVIWISALPWSDQSESESEGES